MTHRRAQVREQIDFLRRSLAATQAMLKDSADANTALWSHVVRQGATCITHVEGGPGAPTADAILRYYAARRADHAKAGTEYAVPFTEADVGKTIGVTGIHDGATTETFRTESDAMSLLLEVRDLLGGEAGPITGIAARIYAQRAALKVELHDLKFRLDQESARRVKNERALEACRERETADCLRLEATEVLVEALDAYVASRVHGSNDQPFLALYAARAALRKLEEGERR